MKKVTMILAIIVVILALILKKYIGIRNNPYFFTK